MEKLKNNKIFKYSIIIISILLCLFGQLIPGNEYLSSEAIGVLLSFLGTLILWLFIDIGWPSLLCIFSLSLINSLGFNFIFTKSFGNSTLLFLLFTFICSYALSKTVFIKKIAIKFVDNKIAKKSGIMFVILFLFGILLLGLFISPSVLFLIILPILKEIFKIGKIEKDDKLAKILLIGTGFTISLSSGMTTISHVFPVLAINILENPISMFEYMAFALPTGFLIFILMILMFVLYGKNNFDKFKGLNLDEIKKEIPKTNKKDIFTLIIFIIVVILWIIPSLFEYIYAPIYNYFNKLTTAFPPLLGTLLLFIIPVNNKPILELEDAFKNGIPWKSLMMCASTLALGAALTNDKIGINIFLETYLQDALKDIPSFLLLAIFLLWALIQTNLTSNMVTATLVATVAYSLLRSVNTSLNIEAIVALIGMLASFAFATPPSMPHIALICASEEASTNSVLAFGSILMVISFIITILVGYPLATLIL